jgi:hypothetical protein
MRTDSTRVAGEAVAQAREFIAEEYGKDYVPASPRQYKSKKSAQEAHEAIRPTSVVRRPEGMQQYLSRDQFRIYKLVWQRFLASQMASAILNVVTVDIAAGNYTFRASGSTVKFPGFTVLYTEGKDVEKEEDEDVENADGTHPYIHSLPLSPALSSPPHTPARNALNMRALASLTCRRSHISCSRSRVMLSMSCCGCSGRGHKRALNCCNRAVSSAPKQSQADRNDCNA